MKENILYNVVGIIIMVLSVLQMNNLSRIQKKNLL